MKKILDTVTIISGIFILICYSVYLIISISQNSDAITVILAVTVMTLTLIPIVFIKKIQTWLKIIFCIGMCFYMISFMLFCVYIFADVNDGEFVDAIAVENDILVMVYGCRTYERPSKALRERLDAALELLNAYPDSICVVSGGQGSNEPITEAESMYRYLVEHGIESERIYKEDKSSSTIENIEFTIKLINENQFNNYQVIGVSTDYHLRRIRILSDNIGFDTLLVPAESRDKIMLLSNLVREYMSYVKMLLLHI